MTKYREELTAAYGIEIGSYVGSGLDQLKRPVSGNEKTIAINFFEKYKSQIKRLGVSAGRQAIQEYMDDNCVVPHYIATQEEHAI